MSLGTFISIGLALWVTSGAAAPPPRPVQGPDWVRVTSEPGWQPRDSSGELVFNDQMWLFGGWVSSSRAPLRDVWASRDGRNWTAVATDAPWRFADLPMTLAFKRRMWLMGGWTGGRLENHGATNEVWSSADGSRWKLVGRGGWSPRVAAAIVEFKGRMWILGGTEDYYFGDDRSLKNDVWSSADGRTWTLATPHAEWSPRAFHQAVVLADKIYVMGGGNYTPSYRATNDVWCSSDGVKWTQVTGHAGWGPRLWFSAVVYRDRMWVLGGWSNDPSTNWGDVWYSRDGREWQPLTAEVTWRGRHEHSTYVFRDKLWVVAGNADPITGEVWRLDLPPLFFGGATNAPAEVGRGQVNRQGPDGWPAPSGTM